MEILLPAFRYFHDRQFESLQRLLGQADCQAETIDEPYAAIRAGFEIIPLPFSVAALTRHAETDDAATGVWLRADPCWLQADMASLRMMACGAMQLTLDEAHDLAAVVRPIFGDAGFELDIPHPERWYLKLPYGSEPPQFSAPRDVLGDDVERHIPVGAASLRWRHLLNEVQVSLHQHKFNERRVAKGGVPVNSLWFWGGGRLPNRVVAKFQRVVSTDLVLAGLAKLAHCEFAPVTSLEKLIEQPHLSSTLIDLRHLRDINELQNAWFQPLLQTLKSKLLDKICFSFDSGERFILKPWHRWRLWRGPVLADAFVDSL